MDNKTCKTCKWHDKESVKGEYVVDELGIGMGKCTNGLLRDDYGDKEELNSSLMYSYPEGGFFWTGDDFGCIHHEG